MSLYEFTLNFETGHAEQKLRKLGRATSHSEKQVNMLQAAFSGVERMVSRLNIGPTLFTGAKAIAQLGIRMEQTRVIFTTFLNSADKANATIEELNEFSNVSPFDNAQVLEAGKSLLAMGIAQDKLIPSLRNIGDIAIGSGKDFNELAAIYGKTKIAGTLMQKDLNELMEAGIPITGELAKTLGKTEDQVKKMASQGKIKFKDLEQAFANLTGEGGLYFELMKKHSESAGGKISTFIGKILGLGTGIGEAFDPLIAKVFGKLSTIIDSNKDGIIAFAQIAATKIQNFVTSAMPYLRFFRDTIKSVWAVITVAFQSSVLWIKQNISVIEFLGYMVGVGAAAYLGYNAVLLVNKGLILAMKIPTLLQAGWTAILTAKQWLLNIALRANPIGLVVGAIAALIALTVVIITKYDEWGAALAFMLGPFGFIINLVQSFKRHWDSITEAFNQGGIVGGLKRIGLVILDAILMPLQQLLELASGLPGKIGEMASSGATAIENLRNKLDLSPPEKAKVDTASDSQKKLNEVQKEGQKQLDIISGSDSRMNIVDQLTPRELTELRDKLIAVQHFVENTRSDIHEELQNPELFKKIAESEDQYEIALKSGDNQKIKEAKTLIGYGDNISKTFGYSPAQIDSALKDIQKKVKVLDERSAVLNPEDPNLLPGFKPPTTDEDLTPGIDNINGGGSKHTNISISMDNLVGNQHFSISNLKESAEEVKKEVEEALLRVVNGLNYSVQ